MAKWGEGDPRWIVEERPDAVNVNNWHWTEKNACGWSKEKIKDLFIDYKIINDAFRMRITEVEKMDGEANANNRKGKIILFYEWDITLKWKGRVKGSDEYITGKLVIPNLSEENELHEIDIEISVNEKGPEAQTMKELLYLHSKDKIREQLDKYIKCLKEEFTQGMILPKKENESSKNNNTAMNNLSTGMETKMKMNTQTSVAPKNEADKQALSSFELSEKFQCTASELYNAFTITELVSAFTQGPVKNDARPGGCFELFGGNIAGEFVELTPSSRIVQKWRVKRWPDALFSTVTMDFKQESDHTMLLVKHAGLPSTEADSTKDNWHRYYFDPIKRTFAFGSFL